MAGGRYHATSRNVARANKYAGECAICGREIDAGAGVVCFVAGRGWVLSHAPARWVGSPISGGWVGGCPRDVGAGDPVG